MPTYLHLAGPATPGPRSQLVCFIAGISGKYKVHCYDPQLGTVAQVSNTAGNGASDSPSHPTVANGKLFFRSMDGSSGDKLFLYVMPTGCKSLKELKVTWYSGTNYSSSGCIWYGSTTPAPSLGGESGCTFMGSTVPTADTWSRIEIPASTVGLDGATITSFKVENIGSQVWVDYVGNGQ